MAENCYYGGMKHRFVPRYEEKPSQGKIVHAELIPSVDLKKILKNKVYVRDICEWCGKTIERKDNEPK